MTAEPTPAPPAATSSSGVLDFGRTAANRVTRVAVVGAGPAGFYTAGHLLAASELDVELDIFERLPTPWGLVRSGVAPDHPKIKSVTRVFEKTASDPRVRFFGNVEVGKDIAHDELAAWYDAVVYAVGTSAARRAGIAGEDLPGSWSATEFVGWYNGHPDFRDLAIDLSGERAVVIGNGNVAIDVARVLTLSPAALASSDIADHALQALARSAIREVVVLGRRGPEQAAFTNPELLELGALDDVDVVVDPGDLALDPDVRDAGIDATARRNLEILSGYVPRAGARRAKRIVLRFLASPAVLLGSGHVAAVNVVRNRLERDADGTLRACGTAARETIPAGLVIEAIGYTGKAVPGLPFDERSGIVPNDRGRVRGPHSVLPRTYVAGWVKRGPTGVIGTNKKCAQETVAALLDDAAAGALAHTGTLSADAVDAVLAERKSDVVSYAGWQAIDRHERALGERAGRPRIKLTRIDDMLEVASSATTGSALSANVSSPPLHAARKRPAGADRRAA